MLRLLAAVLILVQAAATGAGATPSFTTVTRATANLDIDLAACIRRADTALALEGWKNVAVYADYVSATKDGHTGFIVCDPRGGAMVVGIFVTADMNADDTAGGERDALLRRMVEVDGPAR